MRVGIYMPHKDEDGRLLNAAEIARRARPVEEAGIDSIWRGDHLMVPGGLATSMLDPFAFLLTIANATQRVEVGTAIFSVPLRTPYDVVQRLYTLQVLAPGRFVVGVGTGSQKSEYEANGLDWDGRFTRLHDHVAKAREFFRDADVPIPPLALGAWHSENQLRIAATQYDAWIASGSPGTRFGGWRKVLTEGIERYRAHGGKRALVGNVLVDLTAPTTPFTDEGFFSLRCDPDEAARRVRILADLGYDDLILRPHRPGFGPMQTAVLSLEELKTIRAIVP